MKYFILVTLLLTLCSCHELFIGKDDTLTMTRIDYTGNQLKIDGYYYLKDSFEYCFHNFMLNHFKESDDSKNLNRATSSQSFDLPVFESTQQLTDFLVFAKNQLNINQRLENEPATNEDEQNRLFYELLDLYSEFTKQLNT